MCTYNQVSDDHSGEEEWNTDLACHPHAVPHGLDPLSTQHSEHDHEAVHEVDEVPARHDLAREPVHIVSVALPEQLHPHDREDEDNDTKYKCEVSKSTNSFPHDGDEKIQSWP